MSDYYFGGICRSFHSALLLACVHIATTVAQEPAITDLSQLTGKVIDIQLKKGFHANAVIETVVPGNSEGSAKILTIKEGDKSRRVSASLIVELFFEGQPLDAKYDRRTRCLMIDMEHREERLANRQAAAERLRQQRRQFWPHLTDEDRKEFIAEQEQFVKDAQAKLAPVPLRLVETQFFVFVTDLTPPEVDGYIAYLDAMYKQLCLSFGMPREKNIWCGKCIVFGFREQPTYLRFESVVMNNPNAMGTQGLCHQRSDGNVVFAGYKGDNGSFGHVLVHETTHGYLHRLLSSARVPSWLNEGISDWMADKVVGGDRIKRRQQQSAQVMKQRGGFGNFLRAERIDGTEYGAGSTLVSLLLDRDRGGQFNKFLVGIKEGYDPEESLKRSFNLSYQQLEQLYGMAIARMR